jgi:hypothetical protein
VTYADIARKLLLHWECPASLIGPATSADSGVFLPYAPRYPSLGMILTGKAAAITPQSFEDCIADLTN